MYIFDDVSLCKLIYNMSYTNIRTKTWWIEIYCFPSFHPFLFEYCANIYIYIYTHTHTHYVSSLYNLISVIGLVQLLIKTLII